MPQKHAVVSLQDCALRAVGGWVKMVGKGLIEPTYLITQRDPGQGLVFLQHTLAYIREMLYANVPRYLHDKMAEQVLTSINELIDETKSSYDPYCPMAMFLNKMKVVVSLTEVVMHPMLKQLDVYHWPRIMRHVLNQNLNKLVGVEKLNLGSGSAGWDTSEAEKFILSGVKWMNNLTTFCLCFDCTNSIILTLGSNCPSLQSLDITSSRSVTDRCIPALLQCTKLKEVKLYRTSVSENGYTELLSKHPNIQDIGRCDWLAQVLTNLDELKSDPLPLLALECMGLVEDQLRLLVTYCPRLTNISIENCGNAADLSILSALRDLKDLKIKSCYFFTDRVKELLEQRGEHLNSLYLEYVYEIDLNTFSQFCPKLKTLSLVNCDLSPQHFYAFNINKLAVQPFVFLERLILDVCVYGSRNDLEFLMTHCKNIRYIQLGALTGIINRLTFSRVLAQNPMKKLEELRIPFSHDLNMEFVKVLSQCENLRKLTNLESWTGISQEELHEFRQYIRENNIDLDTRTTSFLFNDSFQNHSLDSVWLLDYDSLYPVRSFDWH